MTSLSSHVIRIGHNVISAVLEGYTIPKPADCPESLFACIIKPCWMMEPKGRPSFQKIVRTFDDSPAVAALLRNNPKIGMDHFKPLDLVNAGKQSLCNDQSVSESSLAADVKGKFVAGGGVGVTALDINNTVTTTSDTTGASIVDGASSVYVTRSGTVVAVPTKAPPRFQRAECNQTNKQWATKLVKVGSKSSEVHPSSTLLSSSPVLHDDSTDYVVFGLGHSSTMATVIDVEDEAKSMLPAGGAGGDRGGGRGGGCGSERRLPTSTKTFRMRNSNKVFPSVTN